MSSFKRKVTTTVVPGTRPSPYNSLTLLSTGLSALDDILGGGLPLSSSLMVQADDVTTYGEMLLRFWIAQSLESKHDCIVIGSSVDVNGPNELINNLMDVDGGSGTTGIGGEVHTAQPNVNDDDDDNTPKDPKEDKLKIAFRYEGMKQHATTVSAPKPPTTVDNTDTYCSLFDLTLTRQLKPQDKARLSVVDVATLQSSSTSSLMPADMYELLYQRIEDILREKDCFPDANKTRQVVRIAISSFGSPSWGLQAKPEVLYRFMHRLRALLRKTTATAYIVVPFSLHESNTSLATRLGHVTDAIVKLTSFASSPILLSQFPRHQGLISLPKLPSLNSLVPPSAKLSVLRGLGGGGEGRENNLGFRVKRRRFVIETVNADDPIGPEERKPAPKVVSETDKTKPEVRPEQEGGKPSVVVTRDTKVRFGGEQVLRQPVSVGQQANVRADKPPSVSAMLHKQPELYEF
ncbi:Elongator subunit elp4 [Microbotryomycetes sp. JL221]|nr:Elongator subunit elp4 [Microbotryomycetes sp. JL221]